MATSRVDTVDSIRFRIEAGINAKGSMTYKNVTYSDIEAGLSDDDFMAVAQAILTLMAVDVDEIHRISNAQIM